MFRRCLFCHRDLPANEGLEHFPVGRRVAYDPGRGRLWAVCPACRRWNLAPIEERWEALEELEKAVKDRARLLSQTDNIALLRAGELDIVRVGRANLTEEAWWRYGTELVRRRRTYQLLTAAGVGGVLALMAGGVAAGVGVFGGWWALTRLGKQAPRIGRTVKFGRTAWRGRAVCPRCGSELVRIPFNLRGVLIPTPDGEGEVALGLRCLTCDYGHDAGRAVGAIMAGMPAQAWSMLGTGLARRDERGRIQAKIWVPSWERTVHRQSAAGDPAADSGFLITGVEAEHLLRRVLAYQNFAGAKEDQVRRATSLIQSAGSAPTLAQSVARAGHPLESMDATQAIALEIAINEDRERRLLELELAALEQRWKEEEEIAAIVDGELTWIPGEDGRRPPGSLIPGTGATGGVARPDVPEPPAGGPHARTT